MILYSIIPSEIVFGNVEEDYKDLKEIDYMGSRVMVSPLSGSRYEIVRIISTSPAVFLNPKLQPGQIIEKVD